MRIHIITKTIVLNELKSHIVVILHITKTKKIATSIKKNKLILAMKELSGSALLNLITTTTKEMMAIQTNQNAKNKNVAVSATSLVVGKNKVVVRLPYTYTYSSSTYKKFLPILIKSRKIKILKILKKFKKFVDIVFYICYICIVAIAYGRLAQLVEYLPYKQRVTGSSPVSPTTQSIALFKVLRLKIQYNTFLIGKIKRTNF